ncbi:hypothetical protein SVIOM74S_01446 [Streptomyces violarus]
MLLQICVAFQHRVWKRHPLGGAIGEGTSPLSRMRSLLAALRRGSGIGTADSRALVYGCIGLAYSESRSASSTILPRYITAIRSETCRTTDRSCAMITYVRPSSSWRSSIRFTTCAWIDTSSAETGSSATTIRGFRARARAIPMRCRWPPENSCG